MDTGLLVGIGGIVAGLVIYLCRPKAGRDDRSISIGGNNTGIANSGHINVGNPNAHANKPHSHLITWIAVVVEIIGIGVTLWHAYHLMHQ